MGLFEKVVEGVVEGVGIRVEGVVEVMGVVDVDWITCKTFPVTKADPPS